MRTIFLTILFQLVAEFLLAQQHLFSISYRNPQDEILEDSEYDSGYGYHSTSNNLVLYKSKKNEIGYQYSYCTKRFRFSIGVFNSFYKTTQHLNNTYTQTDPHVIDPRPPSYTEFSKGVTYSHEYKNKSFGVQIKLAEAPIKESKLNILAGLEYLHTQFTNAEVIDRYAIKSRYYPSLNNLTGEYTMVKVVEFVSYEKGTISPTFVVNKFFVNCTIGYNWKNRMEFRLQTNKTLFSKQPVIGESFLKREKMFGSASVGFFFGSNLQSLKDRVLSLKRRL